MLFSYKTTTRYKPYQLMYGLHPLMPKEYKVPINGENERDSIPMKILTSKIIELGKLQEARMQAIETTRI
jgi:hypothetical protein